MMEMNELEGKADVIDHDFARGEQVVAQLKQEAASSPEGQALKVYKEQAEKLKNLSANEDNASFNTKLLLILTELSQHDVEIVTKKIGNPQEFVNNKVEEFKLKRAAWRFLLAMLDPRTKVATEDVELLAKVIGCNRDDIGKKIGMELGKEPLINLVEFKKKGNEKNVLIQLLVDKAGEKKAVHEILIPFVIKTQNIIVVEKISEKVELLNRGVFELQLALKTEVAEILLSAIKNLSSKQHKRITEVESRLGQLRETREGMMTIGVLGQDVMMEEQKLSQFHHQCLEREAEIIAIMEARIDLGLFMSKPKIVDGDIENLEAELQSITERTGTARVMSIIEEVKTIARAGGDVAEQLKALDAKIQQLGTPLLTLAHNEGIVAERLGKLEDMRFKLGSAMSDAANRGEKYSVDDNRYFRQHGYDGESHYYN